MELGGGRRVTGSSWANQPGVRWASEAVWTPTESCLLASACTPWYTHAHTSDVYIVQHTYNKSNKIKKIHTLRCLRGGKSTCCVRPGCGNTCLSVCLSTCLLIYFYPFSRSPLPFPSTMISLIPDMLLSIISLGMGLPDTPSPHYISQQ